MIFFSQILYYVHFRNFYNLFDVKLKELRGFPLTGKYEKNYNININKFLNDDGLLFGFNWRLKKAFSYFDAH